MNLTQPIETEFLVGHLAQETSVAEAFSRGTLHHSLLITGPKGIGKATLGYRIARYIFSRQGGAALADMGIEAKPLDFSGVEAVESEDEDEFGESEFESDPVSAEASALSIASLDTSPLKIPKVSPIFSRMLSGGVQDFKVIERLWKDEEKTKLAQDISVDQIRDLKGFFSTTASEEGWRIAIIDSVDDMNANSANALLKILEEPPEKSLLILVSHNQSAVMPTIKSRCRTLRLGRLGEGDMDALLAAYIPEVVTREELKSIANGSIGAAISLYNAGAVEVLAAMKKAMASKENLPSFALLAAGRFDAFKAVAINYVEKRARESKSPLRLLDVRGAILELFKKAEVFNLDNTATVFSVMEALGNVY